MQELTSVELKSILHSKRANLYYLEHCRVLVSGGRVEYVTDQGKRQLYWNIPIVNTTTVLLGTGTSVTQAAMRAFLEHPNAARNSQRHDRFDRSPLLLAVECHATDELLDDLLFRASVRSQMPEAIAAARTLGAPARARRLEEIHRQDLEEEQLLALDLMEM